MKKFLLSCLACVLLIIILVVIAWNRRPIPSFIPSSVVTKGDAILYDAVAVPNKWGYTIHSPPDLSDTGLTYWLEAYVDLRGVRLQSIETAEKLYMDIYEDMLKKLNAVRAIRPLLANFPLTPSSFFLLLSFTDEKGENPRPPEISDVRLWNKALDFRYYHEGTIGSPYKTFFLKPISEIERMQPLFTPTVPKTLEGSTPHVPAFTRLSWNAENSPLCQDEFAFVKAFCEKNDLHIITFGSVGNTYMETLPFESALRGSQKLDLETTRQLVARYATELLRFAQTNPHSVDFMKERSKNKFFNDPASVAELRHIAFRISFWDENVDRIPPPYIAEVRVLRESVKYYTADEYQRLVLVHEETLPETVACLQTR